MEKQTEEAMEKKAEGAMKKKTDKKFVVGMVILVGMILVLMGGFWSTVARQAKMDAQMEREEVLSSRRAIALSLGEELKSQVLWDMDEQVAYQVTMPAGIYNRNGVFIKGDVLEYGDMVRLYGGELTGEEPYDLTGFSKMERIGRATLEEADSYQKELEEAVGGEVEETEEQERIEEQKEVEKIEEKEEEKEDKEEEKEEKEEKEKKEIIETPEAET